MEKWQYRQLQYEVASKKEDQERPGRIFIAEATAGGLLTILDEHNADPTSLGNRYCQLLAELGADGWEMITATHTPNIAMHWFKRKM